MSLNGLIEVFIEVKCIYKCFLLPKDWKQDVFDTNLQLRGIDIPKILLEALEPQIFLLVICTHCR